MGDVLLFRIQISDGAVAAHPFFFMMWCHQPLLQLRCWREVPSVMALPKREGGEPAGGRKEGPKSMLLWKSELPAQSFGEIKVAKPAGDMARVR